MQIHVNRWNDMLYKTYRYKNILDKVIYCHKSQIQELLRTKSVATCSMSISDHLLNVLFKINDKYFSPNKFIFFKPVDSS